jgi:hypothetical protein
VKYLLMNYLNVVTYHGQQFQDLAKQHSLILKLNKKSKK